MEISALYRPTFAELIPQMDDAERAAWLAERCGKLTASNMHRALAFKKDGSPMKERTDYICELVAERITGINMRHVVTPAMEWGLACEPEAKLAYMRETGIRLEPSRFYNHPRIDNCGATPDSEIAHDGLCEIKCPTTTKFIEWCMAGVVPEEHKPQMLLQLACTGRHWVEFVAFDPRIKNEQKRLFVRRFKPTAEEIFLLEQSARVFLNEVEYAFEAFTTT